MFLEFFSSIEKATKHAQRWTNETGETSYVIESPHDDRPEHSYCATDDSLLRNWETLHDVIEPN